MITIKFETGDCLELPIESFVGSVSTVLSPSFDQFITLGSQDYMRSERDVGSLVLFSFLRIPAPDQPAKFNIL